MSDKMREFVAEVKQLCKDFSDQRDRPYMGDVHAALDGLYEQWQAAQSAAVPVVGDVVAYDDDIKQLMRFYAVSDLISLSRIQSEHIARLQKKLPTMRDEQPRNPRSGGE